jgi:hypothetical protein
VGCDLGVDGAILPGGMLARALHLSPLLCEQETGGGKVKWSKIL